VLEGSGPGETPAASASCLNPGDQEWEDKAALGGNRDLAVDGFLTSAITIEIRI